MGGIAQGLLKFGQNLGTWAQGGGLTENSPQRVALKGAKQSQTIQQQEADQEEQRQQQQNAEAQLTLHQHLIEAGAKPVQAGAVYDEHDLPDYLSGLGLPAQTSSMGGAAPAPVNGPQGQDQAANPQKVRILRPADKSRVTTMKDAVTGEQLQYELPTEEEQRARALKLAMPGQQRAVELAGQTAAATAAGSETGRQDALAASRAAHGVKIPEGSGPLSGQSYLADEVPGVVQGSIIAQEAGSNIRKSQLAAASQILGSSTNGIAYRSNYNQLSPDLQQYFDPPAEFDKLKSPMRARMLAMDPASQNKASLMMSMTPAEWGVQIDQVIPPTGSRNDLNKRTKSLVQNYVARGDFDKAEAAIKDASDQMGRTETGVATARATAPIKIDLSRDIQNARAPQIDAGGMDMMAEQALAGTPPSSRNPILYARVYQRAAALAKERGLDAQGTVMAGNAAKANKEAYNAVNKQYATLKPFADMAEKNAGILEQKAQDVADLGAPILNTPIRNLASQFGSPKVAAFQAALQPVQADFARILNSPTASGSLTDTARNEMQSAIGPNATYGQLHAALNVFRQDAKNRQDAYQEQLKELQQGSVVRGNQPAPNGNQGAAKQPPPGARVQKRTVNGKEEVRWSTDGGATWQTP
jgi:hypothetical protein